jgi:hypothetical protein
VSLRQIILFEIHTENCRKVQPGFTLVPVNRQGRRKSTKLSNASILRVVLVIFGDDPYELFEFNNLPALELYLGAGFEGYRTLLASVPTVPGAPRVKKPRFVKVGVLRTED